MAKEMFVNVNQIVAVAKRKDIELHIDCTNRETYIYKFKTERERDDWYDLIASRSTNPVIRYSSL